MTIKKETIEAKKEELQKQFKDLTDKLKELEQTAIKLKADATAINGAIQVCDQFLSGEEQDDEDKS